MSTAANPIVQYWRLATPTTNATFTAWPLVGSENTDYKIPVADMDTGYAVIFKIENTGDMAANADFQLQYSLDGSTGWTNVTTTSSNVRVDTGSGGTDEGISSSERLTSTTETYDTSNLEKGDGILVAGLAGHDAHEFYYAIQFRSADLSDGDDVYLRLTSTDGVTMNATPRIITTLTASGTPDLPQPTASGTVTATAAAKTASGSISLDSPTASGTVKTIQTAAGTVALAAIAATGVVDLAPKVHLNTTQTLSGATEMTVTDFNSAGTSITFTDPAGSPIGALQLGVESRNAGGGDANTGWIAVTVTGSASCSGSPDIPTVTASGVAEKVGGTKEATNGGGASVTVTASGQATKGALEANGTPPLLGPTASGSVVQIYKPSGTPSLEAITASGVAALGALEASGSPAVGSPTASGTVDLAPRVYLNSTQTLSGATEMTVTAWNSAGTSITFTDDGGPPIGSLNLGVENRNLGGGDSNTGWIAVTVSASKTPSGSPALEAITSSGTATLGALTASGAPNVPQVTSSGSVVQTYKPSGSPSLEAITASGSVVTNQTASGSPSLLGPTSSGSVVQIYKPSGTAAVGEITSSGVAGFLQDASGTPALQAVTASGVVTLEGQKTASGSINLDSPTASGTAVQIYKPSGSPSLLGPTASGSVVQTYKPSGTAAVPTLTASGVAAIADITASGSPSVPQPTSSGTVDLAPRVYLNSTQTLSGATEMTVTAWNTAGTSITFTDPAGPPTGSLNLGVENRNLGGGDANTGWIAVTVTASGAASGSPSLEAITASGTVTKDGLLTASGTPPVPTITASGVATATGNLTASGSPSITVTSSGIVNNFADLEATPPIPTITASGVATAGGAATASGTPPLESVTSSGSITQTYKPSGSPPIPTLTAAGTVQTYVEASGSPSLAGPTATGSVTQTYKPSGAVTLESVTSSGTLLNIGVRTASGSPAIPTILASGVATGPAVVGGGGGSWDPAATKTGRRFLAGIPLRSQPFKSEEVEEEIDELVEEVIEQVEDVEEQVQAEPVVPGQEIAKRVINKAKYRNDLIRNLRKTEKVSKRMAERQLEGRINELVRQRRQFFEDENAELEAILTILLLVDEMYL